MVDFLDNNIETLGMQTKYERMMRVQGNVHPPFLVLLFVHNNETKNTNTNTRHTMQQGCWCVRRKWMPNAMQTRKELWRNQFNKSIC